MSKAAVILAEGFEEVEALTPADLLRRAGVGCDTVALGDALRVTGSHGIPVLADKLFEETDFEEYDALILPGGMPGTRRLLADGQLCALLQAFAAQGKLTAAICAAPTVLAGAGLLAGRRAICYPGMEEHLDGAQIVPEAVVRDGSVITSRGLGTALPFALALVEYFRGRAAADALAAKIVFRTEE